MSTKLLSSDIELRLAERMTDEDDGGGEMATGVVDNNQINQVFYPISSADRDVGRVSLRKLFPYINTNTDDVYLGANIIIATPPTDPNVEMVIFGTASYGSTRTEAKNYIESGVAIGPRSRMHPVGTQAAGQRQVLAYQALNKPLPQVGDVYILSKEATGETQAIKVVTVESSTETFFYTLSSNIAEFTVTQIIITITQPLSIDFPGNDPTPARIGETWIRRSSYNSSSGYYGIAKLAGGADMYSSVVNATGIQKRIVPTVTTQTVVANAMVGYSTTTISAGSHNVDVANVSHTINHKITSANVGVNYVKTLRPAPSAGSVSVSYRSAGIWYTLSDEGTGKLTGDSTAYGTGTINYSTGSCVITLGTDPDIGSSVIFVWASPVHYKKVIEASISLPSMFINLGTTTALEPVEPASLILTYLKNSATITIQSLASGALTNSDVTGYVNNSLGTVSLSWNQLPDANSNLLITYSKATTFTENLHENLWTNSTAQLDLILAHTNIKPNTLILSWQCKTRYGTGAAIRTGDCD